jgi:predicted transcriptional regulator
MDKIPFECPACQHAPVNPDEVCGICGHVNGDFHRQFVTALCELEMTQKEAAEKCGIEASNFRHLIRGNPSLSNLEKLAKVVNISFPHGRLVVTARHGS